MTLAKASKGLAKGKQGEKEGQASQEEEKEEGKEEEKEEENEAEKEAELCWAASRRRAKLSEAARKVSKAACAAHRSPVHEGGQGECWGKTGRDRKTRRGGTAKGGQEARHKEARKAQGTRTETREGRAGEKENGGREARGLWKLGTTQAHGMTHGMTHHTTHVDSDDLARTQHT